MPRRNLITRTIPSTEVTLLCLDIETAEPSNKTIVLPRTYKDEATMLKAAKKIIDTATFKAVSISEFKVKTVRYGVDEAKFIEIAEVLDEAIEEAAE